MHNLVEDVWERRDFSLIHFQFVMPHAACCHPWSCSELNQRYFWQRVVPKIRYPSKGKYHRLLKVILDNTPDRKKLLYWTLSYHVLEEKYTSFAMSRGVNCEGSFQTLSRTLEISPCAFHAWRITIVHLILSTRTQIKFAELSALSSEGDEASHHRSSRTLVVQQWLMLVSLQQSEAPVTNAPVAS